MAGRVGACIFIVAVAVISGFDPVVVLVCDTAVVYFALWHEWILYRGCTAILAFGHSLGLTDSDMKEAGYTFETREGRRAIREGRRAIRRAVGEAREAGRHPTDGEGEGGA